MTSPHLTQAIRDAETPSFTYKKIRNGCWRVYKGKKKVSEHSMEQGAKTACAFLPSISTNN